MHHVIVTRVSLSLCVLLGACVLGFAALVNDPAPAGEPNSQAEPDGAALYATYCGRCHDAGEMAADLDSAADRDARMAELEAFLESHGRAGPEQDRAILQYLESHR